jgi:protein-S-isoprenylcysteine O-methyltransferase Ste14
MHYDAQFRVALGAILTGVFAVRVYGHSQTLRAGKVRWLESKLNIALRIVAGLAGIAALWTYLIWPEWILWASVPIPDWLRWTGVVAGALGIAALAWVHRELGRNFAATLHLRDQGHTLVTSGPYRWVRNPMYTSIYLILISFFLVSANCVIGLSWFGGFTALMISRVPREEALMQEQFGEEYRAWAARTGRFMPRIQVR